jgi:hypothetical protein
MQKQMDSFAAKAGVAGRRGAAAGHGMVAPWQASSAALRGAEGNMTNNIRAAERFLGTIPGVGRALQLAFPAVGGIALLGVFGKMTSEVVKFVKETNMIPRALATALREVELAGQRSADELQKENDLLDNQIAKLEGKPQNNLVIALDDARLATDALEQSLMRTNQQVDELLKKNEIGELRELILGKATTTDLSGTVSYWNQELADKAKDLDDATHQFGPKSPEAKTAQEALDRRRSDAETAMRSDIQMRQSTPEGFAARRAAAQAGRPVPVVTGDDQSANLSIAKQYLSILQQQDRMESLNAQHTQKQGVADALKQARELAAAQRDADAKKMKAWEENLSDKKAREAMSLQDEADYWSKMAASAGRGSALYNAAMKKANDDKAALWKEYMSAFVSESAHNAGAPNAQAEADDRIHSALLENYTAQDTRDRESAKQIEEASVRAFEAAEQQRKAADRIAEETIRLKEASGQLSRGGAAQALMTLHQESFAGWSAAATSFSAQFPNTAVPGAAQAVQEYGLDSAKDQAARESADALGALRKATDDMTQAFLDLPAHVQELLTSTVNGFNSAFSSAVMAHATSGSEYRRGITNAIGGQFRSAGTRGLDTALQLGEGGLLSKLGFGKPKADGSSSAPYYVRVVGGAAGEPIGPSLLGSLGALGPAGTTGKGAGNALQTVLPALLGMIPHFASGGPIPSNMPSLVGENGPELFMPSSSGRIVPNDALGGGGGGDLHMHVDARGATDPAAVQMSIERAVNGLRAQVPAIAIAAHREYNRGRPGTSRI